MIGIWSPALFSRSSPLRQTHHHFATSNRASVVPLPGRPHPNAPRTATLFASLVRAFGSAPHLCRCFVLSTSCHAARLRLSSVITEGASPGTPTPKPCNMLPLAPVRFAAVSTRLALDEPTLPNIPAPYTSASSHRMAHNATRQRIPVTLPCRILFGQKEPSLALQQPSGLCRLQSNGSRA
ncbi:hypothetical protein IWX90DRAFT_1760 [Phyllosticta citrichinensis]|uniref:Uncharacterized protein n=1 Tax=Phyllosticta citrichinensis TaxID=1130410 RepID=A0ABR1Y4X0_9PEZI